MADVPWLGERETAWRWFLSGSNVLFRRLAEDLRAQGASLEEFEVLVYLSEQPDGRIRLGELAERIVFTKSRLTHLIGRMVERGLIVREPAPEDRRGAYAVITDAGREFRASIAPAHVESVRRRFLDLLEPTDAASIGRLFERVDRENRRS